MTEQIITSLIGVGIAAIIGLLILWWGAACTRGTFPRNRILGVRTPTTLRNNEAWTAAHRAGAPQLLAAGWGIIAAALVATVFAAAPPICRSESPLIRAFIEDEILAQTYSRAHCHL